MKGLPRSLSRGDPARQELIKQTIPIEVTLTPTGATGAVVFETAVIGDLPAGNIVLLGATAYLAFSGPVGSANLTEDWEGDFSIGTAPTADNDLSDAGEANIIAATAIGPATAEVIARTRGVIPNTSGVISALILDNTDGSLELNLNVLFDADEVTDQETVNVTATGELHLLYSMLGDD